MAFTVKDMRRKNITVKGGDWTQILDGSRSTLYPIVFSRASQGETEREQGVFSLAAVDEPRYKWAGGRRGLLIESAATNLLFPSAVAQTMTLAVTAQPYTLSFFGTGSVTLSGASTGVVTGAGTTLKKFTFTPAAGSLTLTVSGSVTQGQLEAGSNATSRIITTSAAATRAPDIPTIATAAFGFNPNEGTFVFEFYRLQDGNFFALAANSLITDPRYGFGTNSGSAGVKDGTTSNVVAINSGYNKLATTYGSGTSLVSSNGNNAQSAVWSPTNTPTLIAIGRNVAIEYLNGIIFSMRYSPRKYSAAELPAARAIYN